MASRGAPGQSPRETDEEIKMSNLDARASLDWVREHFLATPAAARQAGTPAIATWRKGLSCDVSGPAAAHLLTDMPTVLGGAGAGPNPGWLLRASIASCTATAIAMRAAMRGIALQTLEVRVESESDIRGLVGIADIPTALDNLRILLTIGADGVEIATLRELAAWGEAHSPVSCTLRGGPSIAVDIAVV
jgi:uncharacterized OsmC-like protein